MESTIKIISDKISLAELKQMAEDRFGDLVKAVVDVSKKHLAFDAELHSDLEAMLLEAGSDQKNLWGINIYPGLEGDEFVEFDSMINVRPSQGNRSRGVDNPALRSEILSIVKEKIMP